MTQHYWNELLETMPPDELRRHEEPLLVAQIEYLFARSTFYRQKLTEAGLAPVDIRSHEALERVPFTEKSELAEAQRRGELIGPHLAASMDSVVRLVGTGGTSGKPIRIAWTRNDVAVYNEMGARALWAMGCRPGDLIVNCFNYSIYAGGVMDQMAFETLGATVLAYGVGRSRELLDLLADLPGPKCLYATPSYAVRLAEIAGTAAIDLPDLQVSKGFFSGEAGLQVPGYRERIEGLWGMSAHDLYGIAELGCQSGECEQRAGMHFSGAGLVIAELIDPVSGAVKPMRGGEDGELVYTALKRQACPILRLRSHDQVQVWTDRCACGRTSFRFRTLGRSDDMFVVKGVNIYPTAIQDVLGRLRPRTTGEFQIVLDRPPPFDYAPRLLVEVADDVPVEARDALIGEVAVAIGQRVGFAALVELVPQATIAVEHKTARVLRPYIAVGSAVVRESAASAESAGH